MIVSAAVPMSYRDELLARAGAADRSLSAEIRRAIAEYLEREGDEEEHEKLFPTRGEPDDPRRGRLGQELAVDDSRAGHIDDWLLAWPERVVEAERQWTRANPADFQKTGKRTYVDSATGVAFKQVHGTPLLSIGTPANDGISCFLVDGGRLVFLRRADLPWESSNVSHGRLIAGEVRNGGRELVDLRSGVRLKSDGRGGFA